MRRTVTTNLYKPPQGDPATVELCVAEDDVQTESTKSTGVLDLEGMDGNDQLGGEDTSPDK